MGSATGTAAAGPGTAAPRSPYDLDASAIAALVAELGGPPYRARQLQQWLDARKVFDPAAMTDLPAPLRRRLADHWQGLGLRLLRHQRGDEGWTSKFLFALQGGDAVETVLMLYPPPGTAGPGGARQALPPADAAPEDWEGGRLGRATVCISTQAGCAMGCPFCATGQFGFTRNLTAGEIVEQVAWVWGSLEALRPHRAAPAHVTNVVFMGMGEPFANADATFAAIERLTGGLGLSARAITVSTVGLVPQIRRLAALARPVNLAVSIHAPDDALRDRLVPVNRTWPIAELLASVAAYVAATRRRVSFEYALMAGVNDSPEQGAALGRLLAPLRLPAGGRAAHVNAIPLNPTPGIDFRQPTRAAVRRFCEAVAASGVAVTVRANRGVDIDAACGQLRTAQGRPGRRAAEPLPDPVVRR